jgi:arsenate reductase
MTHPHHIIFLCVANSARSQMAEGLARATAPADWITSSAGSRPGTLNPLAVRAMAEVDIDISGHRAKGLDDLPLADADVIVTLCAEEECPLTPPHVRRISWAMPDPAGRGDTELEELDAFREARDEIAGRVTEFWGRIAAGRTA